MNLLTININELKEIKDIFDKKNITFNIEHEKKMLNSKGWDISNMISMRTSSLIYHKNLLDDLEKYLEKKNFNCAQLIEKNLEHEYYPMNTKELDFYRKKLKSGYYPENETVFEILSNKTNRTTYSISFTLTLLQICTYCKDDKKAANYFHNVLKNHDFKIDLINREKVKKIWYDRFLNTSIKTDDYSDIENFFKELNVDEKDYISSNSGYYLKYQIDFDVLSKKTGKNINSVNSTYKMLSSEFLSFMYEKELNKSFSITDFSYEENTIKIYFSDESKKADINKICIFLINSIDNFNTKDIWNNKDKIQNHYQKYLNHMILDNQLPQKKDNKSLKSKI